jgi:hypothetical protein
MTRLAFAENVCSNKNGSWRHVQMTSDDEKNLPIVAQAIHKKPYRSPKLSSFGTVAQLTQMESMAMFDDGGGGVMTSMTRS